MIARHAAASSAMKAVLAAVVVASGLLILGSVAGCSRASSPQIETDFTRQDVAAHRLGGRALRNNPIVQRFINYQIARGRDLGLEGVRAAKLGAVTIVWEAGVKIDRVGVVGGGADGGIGVVQHEEGGGTVLSSRRSLNGPIGLRAVKGATETGTACTMIAAYGNRATSCFEKWRIRDTGKIYDYYVYDRWGAAEAGSGSGATEVTIRSRQRRGTEGNIASLFNYWPGAGGEVCDPAMGTGSTRLGFNGAGASFTATFPIASCAATDMNVDARTFSMMSQWKGHGAGAAAARSSQFFLALRTWQGKAPEMADYVWTSFGRSSVWRKSGWPKS